MDNKEAFLAFRKTLVDAIIANPDFQTAKASGKTERFLKSDSSYEVDTTYFRQFTTGYSPTIDAGIKPTQAVKETFQQTYSGIYEWLRYKKYGLNWNTTAQRGRLAFYLTRKIRTEGSYKYRRPDKQTTVFQDGIKEALPVLLKHLGASVLQNIQSEVGKEINALRASSRKKD